MFFAGGRLGLQMWTCYVWDGARRAGAAGLRCPPQGPYKQTAKDSCAAPEDNISQAPSGSSEAETQA